EAELARMTVVVGVVVVGGVVQDAGQVVCHHHVGGTQSHIAGVLDLHRVDDSVPSLDPSDRIRGLAYRPGGHVIHRDTVVVEIGVARVEYGWVRAGAVQ